MDQILGIEQLTAELVAVTTRSDARAMANRAWRVAGVPHRGALDADELLRVCAALAAEGGIIQAIAEEIATRALAADER